MVVAIDGTVCSGKSTIARLLAQRLGFVYCNTGAIYRAVTLKIFKENLQNATEDEICEMIGRTSITQRLGEDGKQKVYLDGEDVSDEIRTPFISEQTPHYAKLPKLRDSVRGFQRECAKDADCVVEGRDIGTVVFPNAEFKLFMSASLDVRALRRSADYVKLGKPKQIEDVKAEIIARDKEDMEREVSPLKIDESYIVYDNSGSDIEAVLTELSTMVLEKKSQLNK